MFCTLFFFTGRAVILQMCQQILLTRRSSQIILLVTFIVGSVKNIRRPVLFHWFPFRMHSEFINKENILLSDM